MKKYLIAAAVLCITAVAAAAASYTWTGDASVLKRFVGVGTFTKTGMVSVVPDAVATKGVFVKAMASQTGNLFEAQDSSGNTLWYVGPSGEQTFASKLLLGADNTSTSTMVLNALARKTVSQAYQYRLDDGGASGTATAGKFGCNGATCSAIKNFGLFLNTGHPNTADMTGDSRDGALKISYNNHGQNSSAFEGRGIEMNISNRALGEMGTLRGIELSVDNISTGVTPNIVGEHINIEQGGTTTDSVYGLDIELETSVAKPTTMVGILVRNTGTYADAADAAFKVTDSGANTGFTYGIDLNGSSIVTSAIRLQNAATINNATSGIVAIGGVITTASTTKASIPCPLMTWYQMTQIASPTAGMCVIDTSDTNRMQVYDGSSWQKAW